MVVVYCGSHALRFSAAGRAAALRHGDENAEKAPKNRKSLK